MKRWVNILLLLTVASLSLWCTGGLMRKCDQATILAGANDLAHGRFQNPGSYYQFDKTYVVYGVCAALLKCVPPGIEPIAAANVGLALTFWSALTVFVVRFRNRLEPVVLLCFLTAPAVLLNTLYVNSTVLSSAFLLLSAVFLLKEKNRGGWPAALFFFLAVGARADVILLLPLILWLITPFPMIRKFFTDFSDDWTRAQRERPRYCGAVTEVNGKKSIRGMAAFSKVWKLLAAGIFALVIGRVFFPGGGAAFDPIFNWKMVAGYTVFGFGAAGLLFALYSIRLAARTGKGQTVLENLYYLAGLAAFLLPVLFFIPQLHAPRYFWRGCEAVLLLAVAGRLPVWKNRIVLSGIALIALLPMVLGVHLPALNRPQITVKEPTLFPSGDGFYPMGGYVSFLVRLRRANDCPIDHNQLVWSAVHSAHFDFDSDRTIKVMRTPMYGYFMLEASLRGGFADVRDFKGLSSVRFYADSRSLMRDDPKNPLGELSEILGFPARFVSPVFDGVGVLCFGEGSLLWGNRTRLFNRLFEGSEYRVILSGRPASENRVAVTFSDIPFAGALMDEQAGLYYAKGFFPGFSHAEAVFPPWMSLRSFRGDEQ